MHTELCGEYVLVMEYIDGIPILATDRLRNAGYDLEEIGEKILDNYASQILDHGFFHADPHPATSSCAATTSCGSIWGWWASCRRSSAR